MADSVLNTLIAGLLAISGTIVGGVGTYMLQFRKARVADESARVLCDTRLVEAIMLLLPSLKSGRVLEGNISVLKERLERLEDPLIYAAYRNEIEKLASIGQVQIAALRLFPMVGAPEPDPRSVRQSVEAGVANALLAISTPAMKNYADALARSGGFVPKTEAYIIAGIQGEDSAAQTIRFQPGEVPRGENDSFQP